MGMDAACAGALQTALGSRYDAASHSLMIGGILLHESIVGCTVSVLRANSFCFRLHCTCRGECRHPALRTRSCR